MNGHECDDPRDCAVCVLTAVLTVRLRRSMTALEEAVAAFDALPQPVKDAVARLGDTS